MDVEVNIGGKVISAIADTGTQVNMVPFSLLPQDLHDKIKPAVATIHVQPYLAPSMLVLGTLTSDTTIEEHTMLVKWLVVDDRHKSNVPAPALLSCASCLHFTLITINFKPKTNKSYQSYSIELNTSGWDPRTDPKYKDIFQGIAHLKNRTVSLYLRPGVVPRISPPKPLAFCNEQRILKAINEMMVEEIMEPHEGPVEWISNIVPVTKKGR